MKKFNVDAKDGKVQVSYDGDADGEKSVELGIIIDEAGQEILKKGQPIQGKAMVDFELGVDGKLKLSLDTDKDGEPSVELKIALMEALSEANILGN